MMKSFDYRLYPTPGQAQELAATLETHRRLYNAALADRKDAYKLTGKSPNYYDQAKSHTADRKTNPFYGRIHSQSAQATLKRLDRAFQNFFRRVKAGQKPGHPRFRSRDRYDSFTFPQAPSGAKLLPTNKLRLFGVGDVKVKLHRPPEGTVKTVTLKRAGDKWFAFFVCDLGDAVVEPNGLPGVGIDVGLAHFLTTSEGETVANPRFLKSQLPVLRRLERAKARKKRGGTNRKKVVVAVRRLHEEIANCRKDFHFKVAHSLTSRFGLVAAESLNVLGMVKNRRLARSIADAGWTGFLSKLTGKAASAGSQVVFVPAAYTSQDCSACGRREAKALSVRVHRCPCGLVLGRDWNAAKNVLARGLAGARPVGVNGDDAVSQEAASL